MLFRSDGTFTVEEAEGNDGSNGVKSILYTTSTWRCDDTGLWLYGYSDYLFFNETAYPTGTLTLDEPYLALPATLEEGTTWENRKAGTWVYDDGSPSVYTAGNPEMHLVHGEETVETEAGAFTATLVTTRTDFGEDTRDRYYTTPVYYHATIGMVKVDGGGTINARVLLDSNAEP